MQWNNNYNTSLAIFYKFLPKTAKTISIYLCGPIGFRTLRYAVAVLHINFLLTSKKRTTTVYSGKYYIIIIFVIYLFISIKTYYMDLRRQQIFSPLLKLLTTLDKRESGGGRRYERVCLFHYVSIVDDDNILPRRYN